MVDSAPPSRLAVIERGGRLVVIDRETGDVPPTAAERMAEHDRARGIEPILPPKLSQAPDISERARAESGLTARAAPMVHPHKAARPDSAARQRDVAAAAAKIRAAEATTEKAERSKQPWDDRIRGEDLPHSALPPAPAHANPPPARMASRPLPSSSGNRQTIVTGKWWDAKGPRTIALGPKGQAKMRGGFMSVFVALVVIAIIIMIISPIALFVAAFMLFRFGGTVLGPMGASIVDKAVAERE